MGLNDPRSLALLGGLGAALIVALSLVLPAGTILIDEVIYALMVHEWVDHGRRVILNGDLGFVTDASGMLLAKAAPEGPALLPQYPPLIADLGGPLFAAFGLQGLFLLNALGFVLGCGALGWVAWRVTGSRRIVLSAVLIQVFCTFSLQYAFAPWPHQMTTGLVMAAVALVVEGLRRPPGAALGLGATAGAVLGVSIGVRVDGVLALLALVLVCLFVRPVRPWPILGLGLGVIGPMVWVSLINLERFGIAHPFTYGREAEGGRTDPAHYLVLGMVVLAAVAALWGVSRLPRPQRPLLALAGCAVAVLAVALVIDLPLLSSIARGAVRTLIDMPPIPPSDHLSAEPMPFRGGQVYLATLGRIATESGQTIYHFTLKKAVLQSLPWLPVIALALVLPRPEREAKRPPLAVLMLVPLGFISFVAATGWDGGPTYNMRYVQPALPLLALAMAVSLARLASLSARMPPRLVLLVFAVGGLGSVAFVAAPLPVLEWLILDVPLMLALVAAAAVVWLLSSPEGARRRPAAQATLGMALVSLAWSFSVAVASDLPGEQVVRSLTRAKADQLAASLPRGGVILFGHGTEDHFLRTIAPAMAEQDFTVLRPHRTAFADLGRIVSVLKDRGTPTLIVAPEAPVVTAAGERTTQRAAMMSAVQAVGARVQAVAPPADAAQPFTVLRVDWPQAR